MRPRQPALPDDMSCGASTAMPRRVTRMRAPRADHVRRADDGERATDRGALHRPASSSCISRARPGSRPICAPHLRLAVLGSVGALLAAKRSPHRRCGPAAPRIDAVEAVDERAECVHMSAFVPASFFALMALGGRGKEQLYSRDAPFHACARSAPCRRTIHSSSPSRRATASRASPIFAPKNRRCASPARSTTATTRWAMACRAIMAASGVPRATFQILGQVPMSRAGRRTNASASPRPARPTPIFY